MKWKSWLLFFLNENFNIHVMFKITFLDKLSRGIPPQKMAPMDRQQTPPELVILGAIGHTPKICLLLT